jgi:thioredoxin-like negative regulator of GroEL
MPPFYQKFNRKYLGLSLLAQNKFQEAETVFRASLAKSPESSSSHYGLSRSLNAQRKAQEALEHAEKAYQGGTDGDLYRLELATVLLACGNTRDAYDRLQFGTSPTNATERALLNNALRETCTKYVPELEASLATDPTDADSRSRLVESLVVLGRNQEASEVLRLSITRQPKNAEIRCQRQG